MVLVWKSTLSVPQGLMVWLSAGLGVVGHTHQVPKSSPKGFAFGNEHKIILLMKK